MIQESLQNIYKHANATTVNIRFQLKKFVICMAISDNGIGFDPNKTKKGIGLKNIKSRVNELNGTVVFHSEVDKGASIKVKLPYLA